MEIIADGREGAIGIFPNENGEIFDEADAVFSFERVFKIVCIGKCNGSFIRSFREDLFRQKLRLIGEDGGYVTAEFLIKPFLCERILV